MTSVILVQLINVRGWDCAQSFL